MLWPSLLDRVLLLLLLLCVFLLLTRFFLCNGLCYTRLGMYITLLVNANEKIFQSIREAGSVALCLRDKKIRYNNNNNNKLLKRQQLIMGTKTCDKIAFKLRMQAYLSLSHSHSLTLVRSLAKLKMAHTNTRTIDPVPKNRLKWS